MTGEADRLVQRLAEAAGLRTGWRDVQGVEHEVSLETQRAVLEALDLPCASSEQCRSSLAWVQQASGQAGGVSPVTERLILVGCSAELMVPARGSLHYRLRLEDGTRVLGTAQAAGHGQARIPPLRTPGYHHLEIGDRRFDLAAIPARAPLPGQTLRSASARGTTGSVTAPRGWVLGTQVYGLRPALGDEANCPGASTPVLPGWEAGGNFSLLGTLADEAGRLGAAALAISPVHALFAADPQRYGPYAPSSRLFLNALYADPVAVLGAKRLKRFAGQLRQTWVDADRCLQWPAIQAQRLGLLRQIFAVFHEEGGPLAEDFLSYRKQQGSALQHHACYEALHEHFLKALGAAHGWQDWPAAYHNPDGPAVRRFAQEHAWEVSFHAFLQWLAARSLAAAQRQARAAMPIGLMADMAVGTDPRGSHAWSRQQQIMKGVSVGAPPDVFQPQGQDWGLTAFSPWALQQHGFQAYIETLRAVLAHAGGMRVDHVMGLARLWLVPRGARAAEGIYLEYPFKAMMDLLVLEAWRHRAVLVGENLGTVPPGFTATMEKRGVLGMSVLWFEQETAPAPACDRNMLHPQQGRPISRFRSPANWPVCSMAMASTHDLPTVRGWWTARDIDWRERQQELSPDLAGQQRQARESEKQALWQALQQAGRVPADTAMPDAAPVAALLAFVAGTPALLYQVALEDLTGDFDQPNLPGTPPSDPKNAHPNWRRSQTLPVQQLLSSGDAPALIQAIRQARAGEAPAKDQP